MIVDDEADVRAVLNATLRQHYEVIEAHDGLDALEKLERVEPDFVLMDVMMPLMDGYQACDAIRKNARFKSIPVMFLSALGTKDDIRKGYSVGANLYLTKPFEPARLLRNIQLFFETNPPRTAPKTYTLAQLQEWERTHQPPKVDVHEAETAHDFLSPAAPQAPPPPVQEIFSAPPPPPPPEEPMPPIGDLATPLPEPHAPRPRPASRIRIMVVDDDPEILSMIRMILADRYEMTFAIDGLQAIERIVRHQPDILLVDIMLPKLSGFQLCQSLRANKTFSKTPILICSARGTDRDVAYAKRVGANDYIVKPFTSTDLLEKIAKMTRLPEFIIRPKSMSIDEVFAEVKPANITEDAFHADSEVRRSESPQETEDSDVVIKRFLKAEGKKEAFEKEEADKKTRRFHFGFGKDKK
jgi:DNA-binding response OmpR family regulator